MNRQNTSHPSPGRRQNNGGLRFIYLDGKYAWKHVGEVRYMNPDATFTDCTDMDDAEFEAFVATNPSGCEYRKNS